ncbi:TetR/AcrR family transcriptional regulator [Cytobacillus praedii]|uniref:TetR/AcrR family transcriptional regulator n=1 Tax=Cytobacillus praedii TaxID=1742358 RepID=A0A4R1B1A4_9BACI|nr:TetR/AcrR family transcriptional regulator [Cytobacillus praedii]
MSVHFNKKGVVIVVPKVTAAYRRKKQLEIAIAAKEVFERKGYTYTSMNDIMLEANIARGTLYSYFDSIEQVFLEVLAIVDNLSFTAIEEDCNMFIERLDNFVHKEIVNLLRQPSLVQARAEYFFSLEDPTFFEQRYKRTIEGITSFLQKGVESGEFTPQKSVRSIARFMLSFVDGLMLNTSQLREFSNFVNDQLEIFHSSLYYILGVDKETKTRNGC